MSDSIKINSGSGPIEVKKGDTLWRVNKSFLIDELPVLGIRGNDVLCGKHPIDDAEFLIFDDSINAKNIFTTRRAALLYVRERLINKQQQISSDIGAIEAELKK